LCRRCYERDPERVDIWMARALARLGPRVPGWFADLAAELAGRCHPSTALEPLRRVERLLAAGVATPAAVVEALRSDTGPGAQAAARLVVEFFARRGLVSIDDQAARVRAWRQQRLARVPARLRPAAEAFTAHLEHQQQRAALYGRRGLADPTINDRLGILADLAELLTARGVGDWASVTTADVEAFLTSDVRIRLATARAFFAFARRRKLVLVDPTAGIRRRQRKGYAGPVLPPAIQRGLLARWADPAVDPRERVVGLLSLIHAARPAELRWLTVEDIDLDAGTVRLGRRARVPLDPLSADALRACLQARARLATGNPHLLVTSKTRLHEAPCSVMFPSRVLSDAGVTPQVLRQTRLADLAHRTDPRVVAAAVGITREAALHYLVGSVHAEAMAFSPATGKQPPPIEA
jgi:integrase